MSECEICGLVSSSSYVFPHASQMPVHVIVVLDAYVRRNNCGRAPPSTGLQLALLPSTLCTMYAPVYAPVWVCVCVRSCICHIRTLIHTHYFIQHTRALRHWPTRKYMSTAYICYLRTGAHRTIFVSINYVYVDGKGDCLVILCLVVSLNSAVGQCVCQHQHCAA